MIGRAARLGLAAAVLASAVTADAAHAASPRNYGSHGAAFFSELLEGRVWLYERPNSARAEDRNTVWGSYYRPDGTVLSCVHLDGARIALADRWRVAPSRRFRALYNYYEAGTAPDPAQVRGHVPIFYDPESGRLHTESLPSGGSPGGPPGDPPSGWFVLSQGWVQESWPRALKDACPSLGLPADLPVNEGQTSARMDEAIAQDPDAPVRAFPESELRAPGATGLALAGGRPTVTAAALARFLTDHDGTVLESPEGARMVLVLGAEKDELWRLDERGDVADVGWLLPDAGGAEIVLQWERLPRKDRHRVGDPFPLLPTGERHAAMRLMDWILARDRDVNLPFMGRENVTFRFAAGGSVTVRMDGGGEPVGGRWWWSRGSLQVALDGVRDIAAWPWRALADHLGRTAPASGGADPAE